MLDPELQLLAGTSWLFARDELDQHVDTLFVDEGGQFALADAIAVGTAARNLVLLGDPNQLPQVSQGSHPPERTNLTSVGFTYSADEPSTFTCRLTGPGHETDEELACPAAGISYENLADGDYSFRVRAHDLAGNSSSSQGEIRVKAARKSKSKNRG